MIVQLFLLSDEIATRQSEEQRDATPASQCIIYFTETYSIIFRCLTCCCSITGKKQVENLPTQVSALWARWQNFKRACLEHWATWRQSLCMSAASLSSLAFRWDFAGKRGGKNVRFSGCSVNARGERDEIYCFVLILFKSTDCSGGKSIFSLFVLFVDVLHEDLVFRGSQRTVKPDGADVAWDGCSVSPAVSMQCGWFLVIVTHCCFSCPSAYAASKCVVMVSPGCVWVCEVLVWWESQGLLSMWTQHS